jgi:hypothetical protein
MIRDWNAVSPQPRTEVRKVALHAAAPRNRRCPRHWPGSPKDRASQPVAATPSTISRTPATRQPLNRTPKTAQASSEAKTGMAPLITMPPWATGA